MPEYKSLIKEIIKHITPHRSLNFRSKKNYRHLSRLLTKENKYPRVLVIGGRTLGKGVKVLIENPVLNVLETDIRPGPRTQLLCDAHNLPFKQGSFDAVVVQAVIEHVLDPVQCMKEITKVISNQGYIYAETPFMQQIHEPPYDFHRFTYLGHRRLFRFFTEIESGPIAGPATVLLWSYASFLSSFSDSTYVKDFLTRVALFTGFWIKYFDYFIIAKKGSWNGASAYYFLGRKTNTPLSDRELVTLYKF